MEDNLLRALRAIELLRHLPRAPRRVDAATLEVKLRSVGFHTTRRMIQRDLVALAAHFPLDCRETERPYGWAWAADATPPVVPTMDVPTALVFRLAELHLAGLLPVAVRRLLAPQFEAANRVLSRVDADGTLADRVRLVPAGFAGQPPPVDATVLAVTTEAVAQRRAVDVDYVARGRTGARSHRLHPLGLVARGPTLLLVARCEDAANPDEPRSYLLHRLLRVTLLDLPAVPPPGFRLDDHVAAGGLAVRFGEAPLSLRLCVEAEAAATIREGAFGTGQEVTERVDGSVELRVTVPDSHALRAWILGFGELAEVVEPEALRAWFRQTTQAMARRYA